eukprot:5998238-Prymnesium_polylepis.1
MPCAQKKVDSKMRWRLSSFDSQPRCLPAPRVPPPSPARRSLTIATAKPTANIASRRTTGAPDAK